MTDRLVLGVSVNSSAASRERTALQLSLSTLGAGFATPRVLDPTVAEPLEEAASFYERRYVPLDQHGRAPLDRCPLPRELSSHEARVLDYLTAETRPTTSLVIIGHGGSGKSTLVKGLCYYLWPRWTALRQHFVPVYVALSDQFRLVNKMLDVDQLAALLTADVDLAVQPLAIKSLFSEPTRVLRWIHEHAGTQWVGAFPERRIAELVPAGLDDWFVGLDSSKKKGFLHEVVRFCTQEKTRVAVFIDNLDRFSVDIHRSLLFFGEELLRDGFLPILVMRRSTFTRLDREYSEKVALKVDVSPSDDVLRKIVLRTVAEGRSRPFGRSVKVDATAEDVVMVVLSSLGEGEELSTLLRLSNRSLHSLYKKLEVIAQSHHLDEPAFVSRLLEVRTNQPGIPQRMPTWMFYHLLLGNHGGSFNSDTYPVVAGLVNLFCNKSRHGHRPLAYFCRLMLLTRLLDRGNDTPTPLKLAQINLEFSEMFSWELSCAELLQRSWFRLIQSHLALTKSCRHYADEASMMLASADDAVTISEAGRFYLTEFCAKLEYLYFMKDDIDWPRLEEPLAEVRERLRPVEVGETRLEKAVQALHALLLLNGIEAVLLERLLDSRWPDIGERYAATYSPRKFSPADDTVFFSRYIFGRMRKYLSVAEPRALQTAICTELLRRFDMQSGTEEAYRN